jgi:ABC-2 type transport system ATP-binding protein
MRLSGRKQNMNAIETIALTRRFGRVEAVRELNMQVAEGSVFALMGPNGAGKSTLIKLLMNLVAPTSGSARLLGVDSEQLRGAKLESIGYVSENQKLPEWMTVDGFLGYWRLFYPTWDRELERRLVKRFELPPKQKLKRLSRGMRMKAALSSALAFHPRLLVLDEPLSGLDPLVRDDLMAGLLELAGETTVLLSSHDLAEIDSFASHVGYIDRGRLLLSEPMNTVRERFRRVEARGEQELQLPTTLPTEWLQAEIDGSRASWTETEFEPERSMARAAALLGPVALESRQLTLREVFLTVAHRQRELTAKGGAR